MLFKIKLISLFCFAASSFATLLAQDTLSGKYPEKWSLKACLDYAKKNNIQINSLRLDELTSQQELLLSRAAILPTLYGSASQTINHSKSLNASTGTFRSAFIPSGSYGLSSSWTLYQGGFLRYDIQQKNLLLESSNLSVIQQENDITLLITQAYLSILLDKESLVYERDVVSTSEAQVDQAVKLLEAGSIARKDLAQLQSQLANDQYSLVLIQNAERQDLLTLKQLLQLPTEQAFDIASPDTIIAKALINPLQEVERNALQYRPEVKNSELGVQIATIDLDKAISGYKPSIVAGASLGTSYSKNPSYDFFRQLDNDFYQQVGLTLSIPIFTKRLNRTNVEEAKIAIDQANLNLVNTKTILSQNVERAYINVLNAQSQYDAAIEAFKYNQETYRIANEQLRVGVADMVEFLQQKNLYIQALQAYIQAKYNAALTLKIYDFYNGIPIQ
jgi:outer membrane protein